MGDKGKKDKGKREQQKRPSVVQRTNENRKKKRRNKCPVTLLVYHFFTPFDKGAATRPGASAKRRRLDDKTQRGAIKKLRRTKPGED